MPRIPTDWAFFLAGNIIAFVVLALDKAGKMNNKPAIIILLLLAFAMTLPLVLGNSWVNAPTVLAWRIWRIAFLASCAVIAYGGLAVLAIYGEPKPEPPELALCYVTVFRQEIDGKLPMIISNLTDKPIDNVKLSMNQTYEKNGKTFATDNQEIDIGTVYPKSHTGLKQRLNTGGRQRMIYEIWIRTRNDLFTETIELQRSQDHARFYDVRVEVKHLDTVVYKEGF